MSKESGVARESAARLRVDLPLADLRTRIAAAIAKADQDWCSDNSLHEDMADAVIRELALEVEDGECNYCHAVLPGCRYSTWKPDNE
jgi:hypothetical protein